MHIVSNYGILFVGCTNESASMINLPHAKLCVMQYFASSGVLHKSGSWPLDDLPATQVKHTLRIQPACLRRHSTSFVDNSLVSLPIVSPWHSNNTLYFTRYGKLFIYLGYPSIQNKFSLFSFVVLNHFISLWLCRFCKIPTNPEKGWAF